MSASTSSGWGRPARICSRSTRALDVGVLGTDFCAPADTRQLMRCALGASGVLRPPVRAVSTRSAMCTAAIVGRARSAGTTARSGAVRRPWIAGRRRSAPSSCCSSDASVDDELVVTTRRCRSWTWWVRLGVDPLERRGASRRRSPFRRIACHAMVGRCSSPSATPDSRCRTSSWRCRMFRRGPWCCSSAWGSPMRSSWRWTGRTSTAASRPDHLTSLWIPHLRAVPERA